MTETQQQTKSRGPTRFPDVVAAARAIGVSPGHLHRVLSGERKSIHVIRALKKIRHPLAEVAERATKKTNGGRRS